jgi:cobalamin biosynthesis Mg chelatase CobN
MTARDRLVLTALAALALLGAVWLLAVSPERKKAAELNSKVSAASAEMASATSQLADARQAQARYASAYASIVKLGKAVPAQDEVPALIYQLAQASHRRDVSFASIVAGTGSGSSSPASSSTAAGASTASSAPAGAAAAGSSPATAGFSQLPFTFTFEGTFADLYRLFLQLNHATVRTASGGLQVSGRLLTIQGAKLAPVTASGSTKPSGRLTGTITATAYVLGGGQGLTGGATASSPNGAATSASTPAGGSSPAAPAVARVTP